MSARLVAQIVIVLEQYTLARLTLTWNRTFVRDFGDIGSWASDGREGLGSSAGSFTASVPV
jgi:hypothetical protein